MRRLGRPAGLADGGLPVGRSGQRSTERVSNSGAVAVAVAVGLGQPERLTSRAARTGVHRG
jgi:hypothetical protein